MSKFKVGDLVKCVKISASYYTKPIIGNIYEVTSVYDGGGIEVNGDTSCRKNHIGCRFEAVDFELYEPVETIENPKETIEKIAVQCDTLDEWKAVLDKLFSDGETWATGDKKYHDEYFNSGVFLLTSKIKTGIMFYFSGEHLSAKDYTIVSAKEYLGAESSVKLTNPVTKGEPDILRCVRCKTINEWIMVLNKLFDEGKGWIGTTGRVYNDNYFIEGKNCVVVNGQDIRCYKESILESNRCVVEDAIHWLSNPVTKESLFIPSTPKKWVGFAKLLQESIEEYEEKSRLNKNKKHNKIKQMTNNIVEFAKNLTLSADEKLLREVGLHDDEGCYTEDALNIALNLESVEIGYKSYQDLCDSVPEGCQFSLLEAAKLLKKYETQLLDIAKKLKEESKPSKK